MTVTVRSDACGDRRSPRNVPGLSKQQCQTQKVVQISDIFCSTVPMEVFLMSHITYFSCTIPYMGHAVFTFILGARTWG
jgi:hypothetical protein